MMTYVALYRTWRPQRFDEVVGQIHVSKTLKNAIINNRIAHAYLFTGPRGTGKTSSAKILAKAVNCLNIMDGEPCDQCVNCLAINQGNFLDVLEIDAASNRGIDEIRDIRDKVKFAPSQGKCKVYIIDEVHMLTSEAFNALLKTLEEPPSNILFILATTEPQKIPPTILSRCQRFDFRKISDQEIKNHLAEIAHQGQITITESALTTIARKASGGMRDGISILDQCIAFAGKDIEDSHVEMVLGILAEEQIFTIVKGLFSKDITTVIMKLNEYIQSGKDIKQIIRDLIEYSRQLLIYKVSNNEELLTMSKDMIEQVKNEISSIPLECLGKITTKLAEVEKEMRFSSQPQVLLEAALVEIALPEKPDSLPEKSKVQVAPKIKAPKKQGKNQEQSQEQKIVRENHELNFQEIQRLWPEVLEEIKNEKITIHAFLIPAVPEGIKDGYLELSFKQGYNFHRNKILEPANKELVEKIFTKVTGMAVKIKAVSEETSESSKETKNNPVVQRALELFGGDIVEIID